MGHARNRAGDAKKVLWHTYCMQGLSWLLVSRTMCSHSWGLLESAGKEQDGQGEDSDLWGVSTAFPPPSAPIF